MEEFLQSGMARSFAVLEELTACWNGLMSMFLNTSSILMDETTISTKTALLLMMISSFFARVEVETAL